MRSIRNLWSSAEWSLFSEKVKKRDECKCARCGRDEHTCTLQVHHMQYASGKLPWQYPLSDCITLCKGCHAREHSLIEPDSGWSLLSIEDLGSLSGICEKQGCGTEIRYEHHAYHPQWGHSCFGSTCIEYLTREDQALSRNTISTYREIGNFVHESIWRSDYTKKKKKFLYSNRHRHQMRIYGDDQKFAFQILPKGMEVHTYNYGKIMHVPGRSVEQVKEMAYIVLKGILAKSDEKKSVLRNLYASI